MLFTATFTMAVLVSKHSRAEVEIENDYPNLRTISGVDADEEKPLPLPKFVNPFETDADDVIATKVQALPAQSKELHISKDAGPQVVNTPPAFGADVEIWLPRNRCEVGWMRWGSVAEGIRECKVLGRGQTVFGSLKLLAGLRATQKLYASWTIGELPRAVTAKAVKNKEHFGTDAEYSHCMFRPDSQTNGATITAREGTRIGQYLLDTGKALHRGKEKWGRAPGSDAFLIPIRMNKIESPENRKFAREGILLYRDDFWLHSHTDVKDEFPLEAHSTWGCPRLPRTCEQAAQEWVAAQNALGKKPLLVVHQEAERAPEVQPSGPPVATESASH